MSTDYDETLYRLARDQDDAALTLLYDKFKPNAFNAPLRRAIRRVMDERAQLGRAVDEGMAEAAGIRALDARWEADE